MKVLGYKKLNLDMELITKCPICECSDFETISKSDKFNHGIENVICKGCSFVFMNPAPTEARTERTDIVKPVGLPFKLGSPLSDKCVFAMQTGKFP